MKSQISGAIPRRPSPSPQPIERAAMAKRLRELNSAYNEADCGLDAACKAATELDRRIRREIAEQYFWFHDEVTPIEKLCAMAQAARSSAYFSGLYDLLKKAQEDVTAFHPEKVKAHTALYIARQEAVNLQTLAIEAARAAFCLEAKEGIRQFCQPGERGEAEAAYVAESFDRACVLQERAARLLQMHPLRVADDMEAAI